MTVQLGLDFPEPWVALRTDPAQREKEIRRVGSTLGDALMARFLHRLLDDTGADHVVALAVLPIVDADRLESVGAATVSVLETGVPAEALVQAATTGGATVGAFTTTAGAAYRQREVATVDELVGPDGLAPVNLHIRYLVPVRGHGLIVLDCSTPSIAYADEFEAIFDGLAATLELRESVDG